MRFTETNLNPVGTQEWANWEGVSCAIRWPGGIIAKGYKIISFVSKEWGEPILKFLVEKDGKKLEVEWNFNMCFLYLPGILHPYWVGEGSKPDYCLDLD